jgi:putative flippase GtrA
MTSTALDGPVHRTAQAPGLIRRLARCMSVSVITTTISLATIIVATTVVGLTAVLANLVATCVATVPSYRLNRRWTWGRRDASNLWREVIPFWILAFCGLALSTVTVAIANSWTAHAHVASELRTAAVLAGHLGGFGALWIVQFVLLDRVLFGRHPPGSPLR